MKAILLLLLFVPILLGTTAYAQEAETVGPTTEEKTVTVPFIVHESWDESLYCNLFVDSANGNPYYRCMFYANMFTETPEELVKVEPYVEPEPEVIEEVIPQEPEEELTPAQEQIQYVLNTIEYLKGLENPTPSQQWMLEQFEDRISFCSYGILAAEAFQDQAQFVISPDWVQIINGVPTYVFPEVDVRSSLNFRDGSAASQLYLDNQVCKGQGNFYDPNVSPQHYKDFLTKPLPEGEVCTYESIQQFGYDCQPQHQEQATATAQPRESLSPSGNLENEASKAWNDGICNNDNLKQATKDLFNCPKPVYEGAFFGDTTKEIEQGPRNAVEYKVWWQGLSCGQPVAPVLNDIFIDYLEEVSVYPCTEDIRITAIQAFAGFKTTPEIAEEWIAWYELQKESMK